MEDLLTKEKKKKKESIFEKQLREHLELEKKEAEVEPIIKE